MRQLSDSVLVKRALATQALTATANGAGVDCRGFDRACLVVNVGTAGGTSPTLDVKLQESSDDGAVDTYADVASATFTQVTTANDVAAFLADIDLTKRERYLRAVFTVGGTSPSIPTSAEFLLFRSTTANLPVAQDNTAKSF